MAAAAVEAAVASMSDPSPLERRLESELARLRAADLYRVRRVVEGSHGVRLRVDGRDCLNFCSNDYLGLASDPRVAEAARRALADSGTGSGARSPSMLKTESVTTSAWPSPRCSPSRRA